jgi:hypothetical protein
MQNIITTTDKKSSVLNLTLTGGLGVLGGLWLIVSPMVFNYNGKAGSAFQTNADTAALLSIIVGVLTIVLSVFCIATETQASLQLYRFAATITLIGFGLLLMVAPYLFNYNGLRDPFTNMQLTGSAFIIIAGYVLQEVFSQKEATPNPKTQS